MLGEVHVAIVRRPDHLGDYPAHHRRLHDIGVLVAHDPYRSGFASHHWHQIALDHAATVLGPDLDPICGRDDRMRAGGRPHGRLAT